MNKSANIILCCIIFVFLSSFLNLFSGSKMSEKRKIAYQITQVLSQKFKKDYGLNFMGISEAAVDGKYKRIGFELNCKRILSKDEGRILLIRCAEDILSSINSNPQFERYLTNYPFTGDNIIINIYIQPPKVSWVSYPNISVFSYFKNNLDYEIKCPEDRFKRYAKDSEPFEEAKKIVEEQMNSLSQ